MLSSFSIRFPLYLTAAADDDLLSTRSNQSEFTPEIVMNSLARVFQGSLSFYHLEWEVSSKASVEEIVSDKKRF